MIIPSKQTNFQNISCPKLIKLDIISIPFKLIGILLQIFQLLLLDFSFSPITLNDLENCIKNLKKTTCYLDPLIFSKSLVFFELLLPLVLSIINRCLEEGKFPQALKSAIIKPLLKKDNLDSEILANFRPVSNLPFFSKLLECYTQSIKQLFIE